jgi:hypothetical protein
MDAKQSFYNGDIYPMIKMELNYFGDPSLTLGIKPCKSNSDCDDHLFCNGQEVCVSGICKKGIPLKCDGNNSCNESFCDEKTKSCIDKQKKDGTVCLPKISNNCFTEYQCKLGKCEGITKKDCSFFNSECTKGVCNEKTEKCEAVATNEGKECNKDLFCIVNSVCKSGKCLGKPRDCGEPPACNLISCDELSNSCVSSKDINQNSMPCKTKNNEDGFCNYGICKPEPKPKRKSTGCSLIIF